MIANRIFLCNFIDQRANHAALLITVVYRTVASNGTRDSVRRVIAYLAFGFQVGHLFILLILLFFITASPFGC